MVHLNKSIRAIAVLSLLLLSPLKANAMTATSDNALLEKKLERYSVTLYKRHIGTMSDYKGIPSYVQALTDYYSHRIIVQDLGDEKENEHKLHHEEGHVFDTWTFNYAMSGRDISGFYSGCLEFKNIFEEEKHSTDKYTKEMYSAEDRSEYFAECFAWYLEEPEKLKDSSPLTYNFIDQVYKSTMK